MSTVLLDEVGRAQLSKTEFPSHTLQMPPVKRAKPGASKNCLGLPQKYDFKLGNNTAVCTVYFMTVITNVLSILFFKNRLSQRHHLHCVGEKLNSSRPTDGAMWELLQHLEMDSVLFLDTVPSLQISLRMLPLKAIGFKVCKSLCVYLLASEPDLMAYGLWLMAYGRDLWL